MKRILIIPLLLIAFALSAAPIGERKAREIATTFFASNSTRSASPVLSLEWAGKELSGKTIVKSSAANQDEAMLYIYNRTDAQGFVVVAGDDNVEKPIVAFSHNNHLRIESLSEGARYLLSGWCKQIAAARVATQIVTRATDSAEVGTEEVLYSTALWNQGAPFNNEAPVINGERSVTGCVATAMSIICYHNKWPEKGVGVTPAYEYTDNYGYRRSVPANSLGRVYNYDNMLSDYSNGYTEKQGAAVAALMKDMGTAVQMMYHPESSGAFDMDVPIALMTYFGYSKSALLRYGDGYTYREWVKALKENIDEFGPTYFSGSNPTDGGHAFVLDGYTSKNYFHINYGWGGYDNGYYLLPKIEFAEGQMSLFYLTPDKTGTSTYKDNLLLLVVGDYQGLWTNAKEFVVNQPFQLKCGAIWNVGSTLFSGEVQVALCDINGNIKETLRKFNLSLDVMYYQYYYPFNATITTPIEAGDRIRIMYKGEYSDGWQWAKRESNAVDEILVSFTPNDIAKMLNLRYDNKTKVLSVLPIYNATYEVEDSSGATVSSGSIAGGERVSILTSENKSGEYTIYFRKDSSEYKLVVVL